MPLHESACHPFWRAHRWSVAIIAACQAERLGFRRDHGAARRHARRVDGRRPAQQPGRRRAIGRRHRRIGANAGSICVRTADGVRRRRRAAALADGVARAAVAGVGVSGVAGRAIACALRLASYRAPDAQRGAPDWSVRRLVAQRARRVHHQRPESLDRDVLPVDHSAVHAARRAGRRERPDADGVPRLARR